MKCFGIAILSLLDSTLWPLKGKVGNNFFFTITERLWAIFAKNFAKYGNIWTIYANFHKSLQILVLSYLPFSNVVGSVGGGGGVSLSVAVIASWLWSGDIRCWLLNVGCWLLIAGVGCSNFFHCRCPALQKTKGTRYDWIVNSYTNFHSFHFRFLWNSLAFSIRYHFSL